MSELQNFEWRALAELKSKEVQQLYSKLEIAEKALREIEKKKGLCIYGTPELRDSFADESTCQWFRTGTNMAYNECAEMAIQALSEINELKKKDIEK